MIMTYLLTSSKAPILSCYRRQDTIFFLSSSIFLLLIFIIQQGRGMPRPTTQLFVGEKSIFGPGFDVFVDIFRYKIVFALIADYMVMEIQLPAKFNIPGTDISCHSGFHPSDHSRQ